MLTKRGNHPLILQARNSSHPAPEFRKNIFVMLIGIDPDVDKSGVAVKAGRNYILQTLSFFQLYDFLNANKADIKTVRVEASWLIKHNWHKKNNGSSAINANIGNSTGRNHETGRKIIEMCKHLGIAYEEVRPLKKIWKGPDGKITHQELSKIINVPNRTNQEQRDAVLLIL